MLQPSDEAELAEMVLKAGADSSSLEIIGAGTCIGLGHPVDADTRLSTARLSGITLYEPAALTVVVKAGTPLDELEAALDAEGQMLPFEPADYRKILDGSATGQTIGGIYSCGISGPRRIQVGACRDAAIGVRFVTGTGDVVKSGGRVMKNVTGYDLVKLLCGAYGTLGVVTEIAFKLLPKPETVATLAIQGLDDAQAIAALSKALASPYGVSGAAHLPGDRTFIRVEGFENSVGHRSESLQSELAKFGAAEIVGDAGENAELWKAISEVSAFAGGGHALWRISLKPSDGPRLVADVRNTLDAKAIYDWGGGLVWLAVPEESDAGAAVIRGALASYGGHATLVRAGEDTRRKVAVFQPVTPAISVISAGLRRQFDPKGILNSGRMGSD